MPPLGYHLKPISKGILGQASKIQEELDELLDAEQQGSKLMVLIELSDLYGAIEEYLIKHHPELSMEDLRIMSDITKRVFQNGRR